MQRKRVSVSFSPEEYQLLEARKLKHSTPDKAWSDYIRDLALMSPYQHIRPSIWPALVTRVRQKTHTTASPREVENILAALLVSMEELRSAS